MKTITVTVKGDNIYEEDETFTVILSAFNGTIPGNFQGNTKQISIINPIILTLRYVWILLSIINSTFRLGYHSQ